MAQWRVMNAYDLEDDLPDPARPASRPIASRGKIHCERVGSANCRGCAWWGEQKDGQRRLLSRNRIWRLRFRRKQYLINRDSIVELVRADHDGLGRIHRRSRCRLHHALLGAASAEDRSREANPGNLPHHTSRLHHWHRTLVGLWIAPAQLADPARECGNTCVHGRHPDSEGALSLTSWSEKVPIADFSIHIQRCAKKSPPGKGK
jgi:hypothetical protein